MAKGRIKIKIVWI